MSSRCFDQERLEYPVSSKVSPAYSVVAPPPFPCRPGPLILIDGHLEGSLAEKQAYHGTGRKEFTNRGQSRVTIDTLPDVALLEIFDSYVDEIRIEAWHTLVHVCRKWRNIVFGSPRRLDLRLHCTARTPVREMLDIWPLLPIVIMVYGREMWGVDNIIAAVEHSDRICQMGLFEFSSSRLGNVWTAMQQPFPALTHLELRPIDESDETAPAVPNSFLGGSAPSLQTLIMDHIPFPGLPKLLLSATRLVHLHLLRIPHSGYFSPEAIVTGLSALARLERLLIGFESPLCRLDRRSRRPHPPTRTLLPVLTDLWFVGPGEYLEDLVAGSTPLYSSSWR